MEQQHDKYNKNIMTSTIDFEQYQTVARALLEDVRALLETVFDNINENREGAMAVVATCMVVYIVIAFGANAIVDAMEMGELTEEDLLDQFVKERNVRAPNVHWRPIRIEQPHLDARNVRSREHDEPNNEDEEREDDKSVDFDVDIEVDDNVDVSSSSIPDKRTDFQGKEKDRCRERKSRICITNSNHVTINLWYMAQTNIIVNDCDFVTITHHCIDRHKDEKEQESEGEPTPEHDEAADAQYEYDWNTREQCANDAPETMESPLPPLTTAPDWRFRVVKEENAIDCSDESSDDEEKEDEEDNGPFSNPNKQISSPYALFCHKVLPVVKAANPGASRDDIGRIVGHMWKEMGDDTKSVFATRSAELKDTAASPV